MGLLHALFDDVRAPGGVVMGALALCLGVAAAGCSEGGGRPDPSPGDDDDDLVTDGPGVAPPAAGAPAAPPIRIEPPLPEDVRFVDVTEEWGITHERSLLVPDARDLLSAGVCVIDVDGEPPLDLFFTRLEGDGGSLLYVADEVGRYVEETEARGLDTVGDAVGCLAFDKEGDGDRDLLTFGYQDVQLFENDGAGVFTDISDDELLVDLSPHPIFTAAASADLDLDGDLDVVVVGYTEWDPIFHGPDRMCREGIPCTFEPGSHPDVPNLMLIQEADGRFVDLEIRLEQLRADEGPFPCMFPGCPLGLEAFYEPNPSLAVGIADFNEDGRMDVFIGNDFGVPDQVLTRLDDGTWFRAGNTFGLSRNWQGIGMDTMGWAGGDIDGDGYLDHVRTDFEGFESAVHVSRGRADLFEDEAATIGTIARKDTFRWAAGFVDHDLDGDLDLFEATGHFYREEHFAAADYLGPEAQPTNLYENDGTAQLDAIDHASDDGLGIPTNTRSLNFADLDGDGRPEVIMGNVEGPPSILRSVAPTDGHWLMVDLVGRAPNREAAAARVRVGQEPRGFITRIKKLGEGYGGSGDPRLHFGLPGDGPVGIQVLWPDQTETFVPDVAIDQVVVIQQ